MFQRLPVSIDTGDPAQSPVTIGTVLIRPHHTWEDIHILACGALDLFLQTLQGHLGVSLPSHHDFSIVDVPHYNLGKIPKKLTHLMEVLLGVLEEGGRKEVEERGYKKSLSNIVT